MDQATRDRIRADYLKSLDIARQMMPEIENPMGGIEAFVPIGPYDTGLGWGNSAGSKTEEAMRAELEAKGIETHGRVLEPGLWWPEEYAESLTGIDKLGLTPNTQSIHGIPLDEQPVVGDARTVSESDEERAMREYDEADRDE